MNQTITPDFTTLKAHHAKMLSVSKNWLMSIILFFGGCILNAIAYKSIEPIIAACVFFLLGAALLHIVSRCIVYEVKMYRIAFAVGWFMAGIAAIYANYLMDPFQNISDAGNFYNFALGSTQGMTLEEVASLSGGSGVIILWRSIYDLAFDIGFEKGRYIGILVNILSVASTGVIAIKIAREIFGNDAHRLNRLILLFSACGLFWLFAAVHIRDAAVLLGVTSLAYFWVRYLEKPQLINVVLLASASVLGFVFFGFLRKGFVFVPLAMLMAGCTASLFYTKTIGARKIVLYAFIFIGMVIAVVLYYKFHDTQFRMMRVGYGAYLDASLLRSTSDSLGNRFITTAPLPLRLIFGSAYLFVFPIPFWAGFQLESVYHLFKSFNVLFFYAVTPLFALALLRIYQVKTMRRASLMFLLFLFIGCTLSIAGTSLETRHFSAFLVPFLVLATLPDFTTRRDRVMYRKLLFAFLVMMGSVYLAWAGLKFT